MKVLHVNDTDLPGRRFNGHDLQIMLNEKGIKAKQFVVNKLGSDDNTIQPGNRDINFFFREQCKALESNLSLQSLSFPFGELLYESEEYKAADIVHYHLIFNYFLSLYSFKKLVNAKPSVWTLHDPWSMTGHCVYPVDCKGWLTGCKNCPHLDRYAPLNEDNSSLIWNIKKKIYKDLDIDIIVASQWMYDMVKKSPLMKNFKRVHLVPFGIDLDFFKRRKNRSKIREELRIGEDNFVIMFRQAQEWKGVKEIKDMLKNLNPERPVTLLTVGDTGMVEEYKNKYQIIEYGWVNDNSLMVDLYSVSDLFLMPSTAEAFGLMAIESMACSLPIIVFEGTSLPKVSFSPECGIALKKSDTKAFVSTVERLIKNPEERKARGKLGRELAVKHYNIDAYHNKVIDIYKEIYSRNKKI